MADGAQNTANVVAQPGVVVAVVGPTASGKTSLAIALAQALGTEIVNADAHQVYRGMAIGTAQPTAEERREAVHHLVDFLNPTELYSALAAVLPEATSRVAARAPAERPARRSLLRRRLPRP